jgi:hypothetical protein
MLLEHYPLDILLTCLRASGKIKYLLYNRIQNCIHKCRSCSVETRNDINVVQHSLVFFRLDEGPSPAVSYEIHGQAYDKWYYPTLAKQMGNSPTKMHAIDAEHPKKSSCCILCQDLGHIFCIWFSQIVWPKTPTTAQQNLQALSKHVDSYMHI